MTGFLATETAEGTEFFASRCRLVSGFLDTSICEACGHVRWAIGDGPHKNMQAGKKRELLDAD